MEDIVKIFAANLNRLMEDRGENLTQLSDRIGVAYSTVSDWQHGRKMPRSGSLQKLADHFGVNITYLTSNLGYLLKHWYTMVSPVKVSQ